MSFIGEAIASAAIEVLFDRLASTELLQFARREKIHDDLDKWKEILVKIQVVLDDAEEKQMKNRLVELWLRDIKNLAYDVEDILDEFATEALRSKLLNEPQASTNKVHKFIPCSGLSLPSVKFNVRMASKIKEISIRLEEISEQKDNLNLIENSEGRSYRSRYQRLPTTSLIERHIYGREEDKEAILELLLKDEGNSDEFSVISIVGMGGMGKTTLAQLVYNDIKVETTFDIKIWVCVSEDFDVVRMTRTILLSVGEESGDINDLNMLQVKLKQNLSGKKFLIVLDDVWNKNYEDWTILCRPFESCTSGSKIMVTTRDHGVSSIVGALSTYPLKALSNDGCLSIFTQHSLGRESFGEHQDLKEIGEKIVKRCQGLPLAAKVLGGLLRGKVNSNDWQHVLNSEIWNLPEEKSSIMPALRLSYHFLPPHLKRCFTYCSILPKGYEFKENDIILLWMAEDFLQHESREKQMEDLGGEYFAELHSRSIFQKASKPSRYMMHDLINELAKWAAGEICFRMENDKQREFSKNLRHLSYVTGGSESGANMFKGFNEVSRLRTFLPLALQFPLPHFPSCDFLHVLPKKLRVLSLRGYSIFKLPDTIGGLKHLRYLDLSNTKIEALPDSINTLYNLETLVLERCSRLKKLCSDIGNLIKMRHLYICDACSLEGMPLRIGHSTSLRTLPIFVVGNTGSGLRELKYLMHLRERLEISGLENVNDPGDAEDTDLNGKMDLKELSLVWTCNNGGSNEKQIATQVLDKLQPCHKLESLQMVGYIGMQFPMWLGDTCFASLARLSFRDCKNCAFFPSIGQLPSLKILLIQNMAGIKSLGPEFHGNGYSKSFQSLEELNIQNLPEWRNWIPHRFSKSVEVFPRLRLLSISNCPKLLGRLPDHLPSLEKLEIENCEQLRGSVPSLPKSCIIGISGCKELVLRSIADCSSLHSRFSFLSGISSCVFLAQGSMEGLPKEKKIQVIVCEEAKFFFQTGDKSPESVRDIFKDNDSFCFILEDVEEALETQELPCRAQYLMLIDCKCLVKLEQALKSLCFLRVISIVNSPEITSFPEAALPAQLKFISIRNCIALKSLPESWMHSSNTSLQNLTIEDSDSLTYIARVQLPPNLKWMKINHCSNLQTVVDDEQVSSSCGNISCLDYLKIQSCPSLKCLWSKCEILPDTIRQIQLFDCSSLVTLSGSHLPKALEYLYIYNCRKLESIAKRFHDNSNLDRIFIEYCDKLETLPSGMNNLTSLKILEIRHCPCLVSLPEGGFPANLTSIHIEDTNLCKSLFDWGLHRLTSLCSLNIIRGCPDVMSFPQENTGMILPNSLTTLKMADFPNLERLSSSIAQNLTCLEELSFDSCPKLIYFPENGLPQSLKSLSINKCPLLKERCGKDKGLYWPMIAQVSAVHIDGRSVFDDPQKEN